MHVSCPAVSCVVPYGVVLCCAVRCLAVLCLQKTVHAFDSNKFSMVEYVNGAINNKDQKVFLERDTTVVRLFPGVL